MVFIKLTAYIRREDFQNLANLLDLFSIPQFRKLLERTSHNNLLVRSCRIYLESDFIIAGLKVLSNFTYFIMMPFLNAERKNIPTENLLAERYLAKSGQLIFQSAKHSNNFFKAKRIKDDLMFTKYLGANSNKFYNSKENL